MVTHPRFPLLSALLLSGMAAATGAEAAYAQQIRGRVVDEWSRSAINEATVTLLVVGDTAMVDRVATAADGFFTVNTRGPGAYRVLIERIGYTPVGRTITVGTQEELVVPAFVMVNQAVRMDPLVAEGRSQSRLSGTAGGFRGMNLLAGEEMEMVERSGVSMAAAVRRLGAGLRVRDLNLPGSTRAMTCVESRRGMPTFRGGAGSGCDMVTIVLDGMVIPDALGFFQYLDVSQFESIEYLPPSDAGFRYGMSAGTTGALVLWTRGRGPYRRGVR